MMEYRISIGRKRENDGQGARQPQNKLQLLKAAVFTVLALSAIIGIFLAAFVIGSVIASILLILFGVPAGLEDSPPLSKICPNAKESLAPDLCAPLATNAQIAH